MHYFVTGASGFIGRRLVKALLQRRGATVHFLIRPGSEGKLEALYAYWGVSRKRAIPVPGDLTQRRLGVSAATLRDLKGRIDHVYHLAAVYDLTADAAAQMRTNVEGTRQVVQFAQAIGARHLHHVSSIAAAGLYPGVFREDMFDEARGLQHPYFKSKHESERVVRTECKLPWTIYRPALVVGDSHTGEMDKVDGPYYFFKLIQRLRDSLPSWMPLVGIEGGRINIVPVNFVVAALDTISHHHARGSGGCFHLVHPTGWRVGEVLDIFARAAHAPKLNVYINAGLAEAIPLLLRRSLAVATPLKNLRSALLQELGLPEDILTFVNYPTRFDRSRTDEALKGSY
ncbi:MAG: SDR family oxidoreductase, partial [Rubrivivax sp.]|nr:SDR family oxidoreductase [Rubrivivax sp.]